MVQVIKPKPINTCAGARVMRCRHVRSLYINQSRALVSFYFVCTVRSRMSGLTFHAVFVNIEELCRKRSEALMGCREHCTLSEDGLEAYT